MSYRLMAAIWALAIAAGTIVVASLAVTLPFGLPLVEGDDWVWAFLLQTLVVALPFLALALLAERSCLLWGVALAITFVLWGYFVFAAISYRLEGSSVLAHMGFDVLLFAYPFVLAALLAGASLLRKHFDGSG